MTGIELTNWTALYAATASLCAIAFAMSIITVAIECLRERVWLSGGGPRGALLFLPKLWWRWQQRYLLGTPAILAIVGWFALTLDWS